MAKNMYQKREERKQKRLENNDENKEVTKISWYPGHMVKAKKQIIEDLKLIDVVIEILDSRAPISSQNPDIKNIIQDKKRIVVLNKSDLADEKQTNKWIEYFNKQGILAVATDSNSGKGIQEVLKKIKEITQEETKILIEKGRVGKSVRALILGIPNVGKSSFINRISKKTSAEVGNKPGVTKKKQWIRVENNIELLDTPGVLWPKFENQKVALNLAFLGTIKDEIIDKTEVAFVLFKFMLKNYENNLIDRYKLDKEEVKAELEKEQDENMNILDIMHIIGKKRGAIVSGGKVDEEKIANILLDDFRTGKLGKITIELV